MQNETVSFLLVNFYCKAVLELLPHFTTCLLSSINVHLSWKRTNGPTPQGPLSGTPQLQIPSEWSIIFWVPFNYWSDQPLIPSCLTSMVQGAFDNLVVWGIVPWHTLAFLVPTEHNLNTTPFLTIVADNAMPLYDHGVSIF